MKLTTKVRKDTKNLQTDSGDGHRPPLQSRLKLDFYTLFDFNRAVPSDGEVGSQRAFGPGSQEAGVAFVTTHWSVVLAAQGQSPAAEEALANLCRIYWRPIYGFVKREGFGDEAEDLTQGFFARLLERRDLDVVRREKGRLRSYLLVSLKHFLINERHRATAMKRGEGRRLIPLDELIARNGADLEPATTLSADRIYERRWAQTVLEQVLRRLDKEYRDAGNGPLSERLKELLADEPGRPSQAAIANELGMTENAVKQAFHRFRQRYQQILREEIAHTVAAPGDVEDELRHLIAVFRT
jgi:RNA polymerase sigma factor (sigma-70 family)